MTTSNRTALTLALTLAASACTAKGGRADYKSEADTGAASPATSYTPNRIDAPDSTAGVGARTGRPGMSGDTNGVKNKANAATNDNAKQAPLNRP